MNNSTKKQPAFFQLRFKYICCNVKKLIFCLPVFVLFNDKFDTDRFTAAVRRVFFDTLLSNLDESTEPTKVQKEIINKLHQKIQQKTTRRNTGYFSGQQEAEEYVTVHQHTKKKSQASMRQLNMLSAETHVKSTLG